MTRFTRNLMILFVILSFSGPPTASADAQTPAKAPEKLKAAAIIIAYRGFDDMAFLHTRNRLVENGVLLAIASSQKGTATGTYIKAPLNTTIGKLKISEFDALILIGGPGAQKEFYKNQRIDQIVRQAAKQGKLLAAIGTARQILIKAKVVASPAPAPSPPIPGYDVHVEGNTILGNGPADAQYFADVIVKALASDPVAK